MSLEDTESTDTNRASVVKDTNSFYPEDTAEAMYLECPHHPSEGPSLTEILEKAQAKWPGITLDQIMVIPEKIHTRHIHYDLYDPSDYDMFVRIECSSEYLMQQTTPALAA